MRYIIVTFSILCFCSLVLLEMGKIAVLKNTLPVELIIGAFAGIFLLAGILIARRTPAVTNHPIPTSQATGPETIVTINHDKVNSLGISRREYEILCEIAMGLSNNEIAEKLFVSESTVKTHVSNLLPKLNARRRTEAVKIAKELKIIN